jgi:hypothetical protein
VSLSKLASVKTFETAQVEFFSQEQVAAAVSQGSVALLKGRLRLRSGHPRRLAVIIL